MSADQLIDITAGIICGVLCARCYYLTKARRRRNQWLPSRLIKLNRL